MKNLILLFIYIYVNFNYYLYFLRLYLEKSMRFLLSARRNDDDNFLISSHEDFPSFLLEHPKRGFVAKLKRQRDSTFELALKNCRLCDNILGCFTCGRGPEQREVLAKIIHVSSFYKFYINIIKLYNLFFYFYI
jgi:hypothetical protein